MSIQISAYATGRARCKMWTTEGNFTQRYFIHCSAWFNCTKYAMRTQRTVENQSARSRPISRWKTTRMICITCSVYCFRSFGGVKTICRPMYYRYCTAEVGKWVRSTSLYHSRQCGIVLKPRSHRKTTTSFDLWLSRM